MGQVIIKPRESQSDSGGFCALPRAYAAQQSLYRSIWRTQRHSCGTTLGGTPPERFRRSAHLEQAADYPAGNFRAASSLANTPMRIDSDLPSPANLSKSHNTGALLPNLSSPKRPGAMSRVVLGIFVASALSLNGLPAYADEPTNGDVLEALEQVAPEVVDGVANVATAVVGDTAIDAEVNNVAVAVPTDASDEIVLGDSASPLTVGLPFSDSASPAELVSDGAVSYDNGNDSQTVVAVKQDGSVQFLSVIENAEAPDSYTYDLGIPEGGHAEIIDGGALIIWDSEEEALAVIDAPWALDAAGTPVETQFSLDGNLLTQSVKLNAPGLTFPIVADPRISYRHGWLPMIELNKAETRSAATLTGAATICGWVTRYAGYGAGIICGGNQLLIIAKSAQNIAMGRCTGLLFGPGVLIPTSHKTSYCK